MDTRTAHSYLGIAVTAAGAFGVAALALHRWRAWTALGIVAFFVVLAIILAVLVFLDRPRLFIGEVLPDKAVFNWPLPESSFSSDIVSFSSISGVSTPVGPTGPVGTWQSVNEPRAVVSRVQPLIYLHIWNEPKRKASTRYADKVHLKLRFSNGDGETLWEIDGRWSDLDQRDAPETYTNPRDRDIPPNGNKYRIDVASLFDDGIYAMNDRARIGGFKIYPLGDGPVNVEVRARGVGLLRAKSEWVLQKDEKDGLSLSPL